MNRSFLYHALGLYSLKCTRVQYKGKTIILHTVSKQPKTFCPHCKQLSLVKNGFRLRDFVSLPIGPRKVLIRMKVQRYKCRSCGYDGQEKIPFASAGKSYTHRFAKYVVDLLKSMTIKDVALRLGVSWDTIKDIHQSYLKRKYTPVKLKGVRRIGIDEFAIKKGHSYQTIVVDLDTGRIIHVGQGKGIDALEGFWKRVKRQRVNIEHIATDLSPAFTASILQHCPNALHVFDHFHLIKLMNDKLDEIRRKLFHMEKEVNRRKILKGTRYLLLKNGEDIFDERFKTRLENALSMNEPLSQAYYLKEQLREIWNQPSKEKAEEALMEWIQQARDTRVVQLKNMADTLMRHKKGILAWYDSPISTAKIEGMNNKIKVLKRVAYGFRDQYYFRLRLYALHHATITRNVG